jgi:predicted CoA-binding protein
VARSITERGGHIFWLHKDLRNANTESIAVAQFIRALRNLDACVLHDQQRKGARYCDS